MSKWAYRRKKNIIFRKEGGEAILFNPDTSGIVVINSTGCFIWPLINGKRGKHDVLEKIVKEFDVGLKAAEKDLDKFIADLEKQGFIERL